MTSYQTVELCPGRHASPDKGVCVMELASMLAEETFTDRPRSVSPVIASFLRVYNDGLDPERRQDLYPYASRVVGTRADRTVERVRARRCREWARACDERRWTRLHLCRGSAAGSMAAKQALRHGGRHLAALLLVDELISLGDSWAGVPSSPAELAGIAEHAA
jgi:hypothetical protein